MTKRGWAVCVGALAGLSLACSAGRANERGGPGATAQADTTQKSGAGTGSAAANEQAASTRPAEGAGGKDPHPLITESQQGDPRYGADRQAQAGQPVEQPGNVEGRNARTDRAPGGAAAQGGAQASAQTGPKQPEAKELPEVTGRVTAVNKDELRVQPRDGKEVTLRLDPTMTAIDVDGRQASLTDLAPGTEVRASYEESQGKKHAMAVHARTGAEPATQPQR